MFSDEKEIREDCNEVEEECTEESTEELKTDEEVVAEEATGEEAEESPVASDEMTDETSSAEASEEETPETGEENPEAAEDTPEVEAESAEAEEEEVDDTVAAESAEEETEEDADEILTMEDAEALDFDPLQPGDVLEGTIVQVNDENVLVDVRYKSDGVIPLSELRLKSGEKPEDVFDVGQEIPVYILSVDGRDGAVLASYRRALDEIAWDHLYELHEENATIEAPVVEEVKGGLVLDVLGLRGFMPASHVDRGFVSDLSQYVGEEVRAKVVELDRNKNRIIVSRKAVLEKEHAKQREQTWAELEEGQVREGVVKGITDFGAFVDLGGVDGLLHVSQMSWGRVDHPSDVLGVGEEIEVKVLKVDREEEKISLGLKQLLPDPWETIEDKYSSGQIVKGRIMRIAPFGAFVQLEPGVEGLVHISELADYHVTEPSEVVSEGEDVQVKVLRVQPDERRISLSLKEARREVEPTPRKTTRRTGNLTLGDVFGDLLTETRDRLRDEENEENGENGENGEESEDEDEEKE
ncbi:MAG: 30S ribosomal protein S1 [Bacillota bacterium]